MESGMSRRRVKGQALVMGLVVLFFGTITLFYVFSTGQVSADKQRVTNAADAAAYSAALWRARVLNYDAYSNRAMIANEVAIAQTLTLLSEMQYFRNFAACLGQQAGDGHTCQAVLKYILLFFPEVSGPIGEAGDILQEYISALRPVVAGEVLARSRVMNAALSASQSALTASTNFLTIQPVANQVAQANDARFSATVLPDTFAGPGGFTTQYSGNNRDRLANVVRAGLDRYSQDRGWDLTAVPPLPFPVCVGIVYTKRGGTTLASSLDRWEAADDLSEWQTSLDIKHFRCKKSEAPLAWGDRQASGGSSNQDTGHVNDNPKALSWARGATTRPSGYAGIQKFYDLNYNTLKGGTNPECNKDAAVKNPTCKLGVVVRMNASDLRTANTLNIGVGRLRMEESTLNDHLSSVAAAEVYFKRPVDRADGRVEYPSLFNPYWQARLADPSVAQRALALTLR
jgi:hypothetical protein